jgi:dipeptidyl aminopeptidase/acylaminoacyl peptidase
MKRYISFLVLIFSALFILPLAYSQRYSIEQYLNIRGATSPSYSYDNSRIYFIMSVTGTNQLWYVDNPGAWPKQVTFFNDRITGYSPNPKRNLLLISKDEGGSEYSRFYLAKGDGTELKLITSDKPKILHGFGRWAEDGSFFTYFTNERSPYYYDIYKYNVDSDASELLYSSDHSNFPSAISPDGRKMIITRSYNTYDNDLYLLDIASKSLKLLTTHDNFNEPAEFFAFSFNTDGTKLYYRTNRDHDFYRFAVLDLNTGKTNYPNLPFLVDYNSRDVARADFSIDKNLMLLQINDNGYDRLFMYDFALGKEVIIPASVNSTSITARAFSKDNSKLIIGINSSSNPSVLYQWDLISGSIDQVTYPTLAGIEPSIFIEPELLSYRSFDGLEIPSFLYLPNNPEKKKLPCIISIHGGPESQATYGFSPVFQYFLDAGYAIAEPNVRGSTGYGKKYASLDNVRNRENSVKDIAALVDYLRSRDDIDPNRIIVHGGSYGGYMVLACLTLYPEMFAAGIDVVGISNFVTFLQNTADYRRNNRESEYGSLDKDMDFMQSISPLNKVDKIKAPLLIIHGRNDPRVPVTEAEQMHDAIISRGGVSELLIYEDEGHGIAKLKNRLDLYPKIIDFLNKHVKDK